MKASIISFFCILLGYSLFFDKDETKEFSDDQPKDEVSIIDVETGKSKYASMDTIDYYAKQKDLLFEHNYSHLF
jgi:hypothetical protein